MKKLLVLMMMAGLVVVALTPFVGFAQGQPKVTICHVPPGNPDNPRTITIGAPAVERHLENHPGDRLGPCAADDDDDDDGRGRGGGGGGGPAVSFDDQELESGGIETETSLSIEGNNNNQCAGLLQFGNTGNFANQQGTSQYDAGGEFSQEFAGPETEFGPENETGCEQAVQQASSASSTQ